MTMTNDIPTPDGREGRASLDSPPAARPHASRSLLGLCRLVGKTGRKALRELHDFRRPFLLGDRRVSLVDFITFKCEGQRAWECAGRNPVALDSARMTTIEKFSSIPRLRKGRRRNGPDARWYFKAIVAAVEANLVKIPDPTLVDEEQTTEQVLRAFVIRHVYLSCREAYRRVDKLVSRFAWHVDGEVLVLWLPLDILGPQRRHWLETHVGPVDTTAPCERDRVQELIDGIASRRSFISLSDVTEEEKSTAEGLTQHIRSWEEDLDKLGLAEAVVQEKVANIHKLRPCVRALGRRLVTFLRAIFLALEEGRYRPARIGAAYCVTKPSMSRFMGARRKWRKTGVPDDLVKNVAYVIAHEPHFIEVAKAAGVWDIVRDVAEGKL